MIVSGVSGNATFDQQKRFPFMFNGHSLKLDYTKTFYELKLQQTSGGTIAGSPVSGESGTKFNLSATPLTNHWHLDSYGVSGATMTGSSGTYTSADVSAKPAWHEDPKYTLTVQQTAGGTLAGAPSSGYSGDKFGLTPTPSAKYSLVNYSVTGATMTGNSGTFTNSNVTAKANWQYNPETKTVYTTQIINSALPMMMYSTAANGFLGLRHDYKDAVNGQTFGYHTDGYNTYKPYRTLVLSAYPRISGGLHRVYAFPTIFSGLSTGAYISALSAGNGQQYVQLAWDCYSGKYKKYFGNNQSQYSSYSEGYPTTYHQFNKVPNGINFGNSAFISGYTGCAIFRILNSGVNYKYRTIYDGVTSNWTTGRTYDTSMPIFVYMERNVMSANEPWQIEFSSSNDGVTFTSGYRNGLCWDWQQGQSVAQHTVQYPCWSGKLCYKE